jgi:hypothetical protein
MAQPQGPPRRDARPRAKTPAERADEAAAVQQRLKREAAERREAAKQRAPVHGRANGRRRTP